MACSVVDWRIRNCCVRRFHPAPYETATRTGEQQGVRYLHLCVSTVSKRDGKQGTTRCGLSTYANLPNLGSLSSLDHNDIHEYRVPAKDAYYPATRVV